MAGLIISVVTNKVGTGKTTIVVSLGQAFISERFWLWAMTASVMRQIFLWKVSPTTVFSNFQYNWI
jgi:hypothetical protein